MGYYSDVYLKRVNRFGDHLQERIINKKEYDFDNFVQKSPNKVTVFNQDIKYSGVLQTKEYNETETIDYFLTYKSIKIPTGTILKVLDIKDPELYSFWIVIAKDNFVSAGYNRYTVVKIDREIRWITEKGYIYKALVHVSGGGANARDDRTTSNYKSSREAIVFLPNRNVTLTMSDNKEIKRGIRINIKDQVWKISGKDNVTTEGVAYVTLEEDYMSDEEDLSIYLDPSPDDDPEALASASKLDGWEFNSSLPETDGVITLQNGKSYSVDFTAKYFGESNNSQFIIEVTSGKNYITYNNRTITCAGIGQSEITVRLADSPDIYKIFKIKVAAADVSTFSVEGLTRLKRGFPETLTSTEFFSVEVPEEYEKIVKITPKGNQKSSSEELYKSYEIIVDQIIEKLEIGFESADGDLYYIPFKVESPWIGG